LAPQYTDAKLIVGAHNYVMGNLSLAVRMAVALVGLSGDKDKGLQYLSDDYNANVETSVDAGVVLMVFLRREHRYREALQIARVIGPRFPRNYLLPLEEANLLRASGKNGEAQAEEQYRRVWQNGRWDSVTCCAARRNIRPRLRLTRWSVRLRGPIRNCCRKRIWERAKCMTRCRSGTWQ
jgi:hypothetical protein